MSEFPPVFGAATKLTLELPLFPEAVIVNHEGVFVDEVQEQPAGAITPTAPAPPVAGTDPAIDCKP